MAITKAYALSVVTLDAAVFNGITAGNIPTGTEVRGQPTSGEALARFASIVAQAPKLLFSTLNIAAALDIVGVMGHIVGAVDQVPNLLSAYYQQFAPGASRMATSVNQRCDITAGIIVPRTLSVSGNGDATLSYEAFAIFDGTNIPLIVTPDVALPAVADAERFAIGPVTLESIPIPQVTGIDIDFGLSVIALTDGGEIYPTMACIQTVAPKITIKGIDPDWLADAVIPLLGLPITQANTTIFLRKRLFGQTFVLDETAEHVSFTAGGIAHIEEAVGGSGQDPATCSLVVTPIWDGTNDVIVVDTSVAIEEEES